MIEQEFKEEREIFRHKVFIREDKKYGIADPDLFVESKDVVNLLEYFEKRWYDFLLQTDSILYFRKKQNG